MPSPRDTFVVDVLDRGKWHRFHFFVNANDPDRVVAGEGTTPKESRAHGVPLVFDSVSKQLFAPRLGVKKLGAIGNIAIGRFMYDYTPWRHRYAR